MSYLYSMFANQVDGFCESSELPDCNQELLKYGLRKLKDMSEDHLDFMDPYQRNANNISKYPILVFCLICLIKVVRVNDEPSVVVIDGRP